MAGHPLLRELLALVAPPACSACRGPLAGAGAVLCPGCRASVPWLLGRLCPRCALPLGPGSRRCPAREAPFSACWAAVAYEGVARELVLACKFGGAFELADLMAAQLAARLPAALSADAVLVPVPLPEARRRHRGFDQAALLAERLGRRAGLPVRPCLRRTGRATRQLGAGRAERLERARLSLRVRGAVPPVALLVDDVHTTGATLAACARALRAAGVEDVRAVTYARALD